MKLLHLHPSDRAWLRRWLRSNISFFVVATTLLVAVRYQPEMPTGPRVSASDGDSHRGGNRHDTTDAAPRSSGQRNPVAPQGWRRTTAGWEHVSTWPSMKSINQLIAEQRDLEPEWIRAVFGELRRVSPLMVALLQITAIATIVNISKSRMASRDSD